MKATIPWPTLGQYLVMKRTRPYNVGRVVKSYIILRCAKYYKEGMIELFSSLSWAERMFRNYPELFRAPLDSFLDIRHLMKKRFSLLIADILAIDQVLDSEQLYFISRGRALNIWCSEELELRVDLDLNLEAKEGLWRLSLRQIDGNIMIYSLSFAFVDDALFIGAVQGSSSQEAAALIRQATKATHGLRPPFFLIEVLRALARKWNVKRIVGVDSQFQLKANKGSSDSERVHFDYAGRIQN